MTSVISTETQTATLKLRNNPLETEKTHLIEALSAKIQAGAGSYGDWRDDLLRDGYVVVKGALSEEKALEYRSRMLQWLKAKSDPSFDIEDKSTWHNDKLPDHSNHGIFSKYALPHEKFFWDLRQEPGIRGLFEKLYGTEKLLASVDAVNFSFPGIKTELRDLDREGWPHVDQSPFRNGLACVQGIAQFCPAGPKDGSLIVLKYSHKLIEKFFTEVVPREKWPTRDMYMYTKEDYQWLLDHGAEYVKVEAEPGDFILWDSRTAHWGQSPAADSEVIRTIAYLCYTPAEWATEDQAQKKREAFEKWFGTTHWPHDNISVRNKPALLANGEVDPKDIGKPLEIPEFTDDLKKLAGLKSYD